VTITVASATANGILALTRLRARRLALWMEHLWQSGQASPDQGPAISPGEVLRLLTPDATQAAEAALFAADEPAMLCAWADAAAADLAADQGWRATSNPF
jgi:hypothetical protein